VQGRKASISKDYVTLFTHTKGGGRNPACPETAKKEALKELTALHPYNFLDGDTEYGRGVPNDR
jgi:hypothetical protein